MGTHVKAAMLALLVLGGAAAARAGELSQELSIGNTQSTPQNPRSGNLSDSLEATFDPAEIWSLSAGVRATLEGATPAPPGTAFGNRGGLVSAFWGGAQYRPNDTWTLGLTADFSPRSTQRSGTQLVITSATGAEVPANALLSATSSNAAVETIAQYDSAGESNLEWSLSGGIALTHFETDQRIVALQEANGSAATTASITRYCQSHPCSQALLRVIGAQPAATLDSGRISLEGTLTLFGDTDVTVSGDYYRYRQDPAQVGYFSVGSAGRTQIAGGAGVPIGPLSYLVRPEIARRFGDFSIRLWAQAGRYVSGAGQSTRGAGLKLQYKLTKSFRMWAAGSGQRDVDSEGAVSNSTTVALGAAYRF